MAVARAKSGKPVVGTLPHMIMRYGELVAIAERHREAGEKGTAFSNFYRAVYFAARLEEFLKDDKENVEVWRAGGRTVARRGFEVGVECLDEILKRIRTGAISRTNPNLNFIALLPDQLVLLAKEYLTPGELAVAKRLSDEFSLETEAGWFWRRL
jgi:hypothetical protein